jgi:hypothetical protein
LKKPNDILEAISQIEKPSPTILALKKAIESYKHKPTSKAQINAAYLESRARVLSYMSTGTEANWIAFLEGDVNK